MTGVLEMSVVVVMVSFRVGLAVARRNQLWDQVTDMSTLLTCEMGDVPVRDTVLMSSKDLIAEHALRLFETEGYASTTVRRIAGAAGVDPAMVIRHFGSKESLFLEVVGLDGFGDIPIDGPIEGLGERLVAQAVDPARAGFRRHLAAMLRASDREIVREGLRDASRRVFVDRLADALDGEDARLRAHLISAQLGGLFQAWSVIEDEQIIGAPPASIIVLYGAAIQALVDPRRSLSPATPPAP